MPKTTNKRLPLAVSLTEAARLTSLSRGALINHARAGKLKVTKVGRRVLVPIKVIENLVRNGLEVNR